LTRFSSRHRVLVRNLYEIRLNWRKGVESKRLTPEGGRR
jgi:hypothetical protein